MICSQNYKPNIDFIGGENPRLRWTRVFRLALYVTNHITYYRKQKYLSVISELPHYEVVR